MRNRRRKVILLALVLVVVLGLCTLFIPSGPPDPIYNGKHLSYWLNQPLLYQFNNPNSSSLKLGPNPTLNPVGPKVIPYLLFKDVDTYAIPYLLAALRNDNGMHKYYAPCWNWLPDWLQKRLPPPVPEGFIRQNAIFLLTQLGDNARPAIPALADIVRDGPTPGARRDAIALLGNIGKGNPVARQALIDAAKADSNQRGNALEMLRLVDPVAAAQLATNEAAVTR